MLLTLQVGKTGNRLEVELEIPTTVQHRLMEAPDAVTILELLGAVAEAVRQNEDTSILPPLPVVTLDPASLYQLKHTKPIYTEIQP